MRLDSHSSDASSLEVGDRKGPASESDNQNKHQRSFTVSNNSTTFHIPATNPDQPFLNNEKGNCTKSNITSNNTAATPSHISTDNEQIQNPYNFEHSLPDAHQNQTHHNDRNNSSLKPHLSKRTNTHDDKLVLYDESETNNTLDITRRHYSSTTTAVHNHPNSIGEAYNYSAAAGANELLNRYCLEQTIRQLHEFHDVRNLSNSSGNSMSGPTNSSSTNSVHQPIS